ncbi:MAG: LysM domain-containing protein, partial [bacterium]|nr:LysM domain-containing protein [bacterium]
HRVETGSHETVIKDFRQRMSVKKEEAMLHHRKTSFLGMVCGSLSVAILAGGVVLVNNYAKMQKMESVLTSVLPQGMSGWSEYAEKIANEPDFIIEEIKGNVYPTEALQTAADESGSGEASGTGSSISGSGGAAEGTPGMAEAAAGFSETGSGEAPKGESGAEAGSGASSTTASEQRASGQGTSGPAASEAKAPTGSTELGTSGSGSSMAGASEKEAGAGASAEAGFTESGQSLVGFGKGSRVYEVGPGETLYGICWKEYGDLTQLGEICRLNGLEDENRILAGQALILP